MDDIEEPKMFINELIICNICNKKFDDPYTCNKCKKTFCEKHTKNKKYCPICKEETNIEKNYLFDRILKNESLKYVCDCGREFENEEQLKFHKKNCILKSFECKFCNFKSKGNNETWNHIKENHKDKILQEFGKKIMNV